MHFLEPGESRAAAVTTRAGLQRLNGTGRVEVADARDTVLVPVSSPDRFLIEFWIDGTPVHRLGYDSPLLPPHVEVPAEGDAPVLVVDVPEARVARVLEALARQR